MHGVFTLLSKIDPYKANGPDNIPARVWHELAHELPTHFLNSLWIPVNYH